MKKPNVVAVVNGREIYDLAEAEKVVRYLRRRIALRQYWQDAKFVGGILLLAGLIVTFVYCLLEVS